MRFLVRVYNDSMADICKEFEYFKDAEEFAKKYKRYAIFGLLIRHESHLEERE